MALSAADKAALLPLVRMGDFNAIAAALADLLDGTGDLTGATVSASTVSASTLTTSATATVNGLVMANVAVTATADGTGTGVIPAAAGHVTVTSANAAHIVTLPAPVVGKVVYITVGTNGCELRSSAPATIGINGGTGASAESAIPANTFCMLVCKSATDWVGFDLTGVTFAAIEAAA